MEEIDLKEIQRIGYDLLLFLKKYCEKNGLQYYLSNGTLLGAVKYGGYIPWDDDVDVFMTRKDYDKLIHSFCDTKDVKLLSNERNKGYYFPFAKLCDNSTVKIEAQQQMEGDVRQGICIDIFPLDNYSNCYLAARVQAAFSRIKIALFTLERMHDYKGKGGVKKAVYILAKAIGRSRLQKWILRLPKVKSGQSRYVGNRVWAVYGTREVVKSQCFKKTLEADFENEKFIIPVGFDEYLTSLYGDYRSDPPKEKQKTHHSYKAYRL